MISILVTYLGEYLTLNFINVNKRHHIMLNNMNIANIKNNTET